MANFGYLATPVGILRLLSMLFLIISLSLGGHAFEHSMYNVLYRYWTGISKPTSFDNWNTPGLTQERSFVALGTIVLILSVVPLLARVVGSSDDAEQSSKMKAIDIAFHGVGAILLAVAGGILIDSSRKIKSYGCKRIDESLLEDHKCQYRGEKDFGGMFAIAASVLYVLIIVLQVIPGCKGRSRGGGGGA